MRYNVIKQKCQQKFLQFIYFLAQASDLQMGREVAFLLARTGKVYYAGNGARLGLQVNLNVSFHQVFIFIIRLIFLKNFLRNYFKTNYFRL